MPDEMNRRVSPGQFDGMAEGGKTKASESRAFSAAFYFP